MKIKKLKREYNAAAKLIRHPAGLMPAAFLAAAGSLMLVSGLERNNPEYACYEVSAKGKISEDVRLVFLSDLHEKSFGEGNIRLLDMIERADPDMVLIGGDMTRIMKKEALACTGVTEALVCELAGKYPVYMANGNHEQRFRNRREVFRDGYERFVKRLEDAGAVCLSDSTADAGGGISVSGLDIDDVYYRPLELEKMESGYVRRKLGSPDRSRYNILLAHSPAYLDAYARYGADLVLSGHNHGGTIRITDKVGLMTPQYRFFSSFVVGRKSEGGTDMIISPGLGTHSVNIRLNDRPQVVVVDIKKQ